MLTIPKKLKKGDTVCTISLSWGGAGDKDLLWRYNIGKKRLEEYGLNVIEMPHTLSGSEFTYNNPKKRAEDLMSAFKDPNIKAIFSCIGGDDSIRMIPYIDFDVIKNNPKIFIGYSDSTVTHLICYKAGVRSYYGASVLAEFAENNKIFDYTNHWVKKVLFTNEIIGNIPCCDEWTGDYMPWTIENKYVEKNMVKNQSYQLLQGEGTVTGKLIGGCMDVLEFAKGTCIFPSIEDFENSILFLETSEDTPTPTQITYRLRNYGAMGILNKINGIIFAKPYQEKYFEEYKQTILKVIKEFDVKVPILYNASFGHNEPMCVIPYGAMAEINCNNNTFSILENGTI